MKILAYDTSQEVLRVAVCDGPRVLAAFEAGAPTRHSQQLIPMIQKALKKARLEGKDLDGLVVGVGPGSFTGIRVGVTTAKVLAFVWNKKVLGLSSLEILADSVDVPPDRAIAALMDARKGQVYAALFQKNGRTIKTLEAPVLTTENGFLKKVRARTLNVYGNSGMSGGPAAFADTAMKKAAQGKFVSADDLEPLYLHPRDCNVTKK